MQVNHVAPQSEKDIAETKQDALLQELATKTPAEIGDFVNNNFAQLNATQRKFLKVLALCAVQFIRKNL